VRTINKPKYLNIIFPNIIIPKLTAILFAGSNGQLGVVLEGVHIELVFARTGAGKDLVHFRVQQHLIGILIAGLQKQKNKTI